MQKYHMIKLLAKYVLIIGFIMKKHFKSITLFVMLLLFHTTSLFAIAERYQIINLGLQKYQSSRATSINNQGWICGLLSDDDYLNIFVLDQDRKIALRQEYRTSSAILNNSNELFGSAIYRVDNSYWIYDEEQVFKWSHPFKYFQYFNFYYLGCPKGQYSSPSKFKNNVVWDANDLGQILVMNCGTFANARDEFNKTATWVYNKKSFVKIVDPQFQAGFKINNHSQILGSYFTGSSLTGDRQEHVSIYNYADKTVRLLDLPSSSFGQDLNDHGQVVGSFYCPHSQMWKGFVAEPTGEILDMQNFYPTLINNKGLIVGSYNYAENEYLIGLWENGIFSYLMDLVTLVDDAGNIWDSIMSITDINDEGYMIGQGKINGINHSLLLKPLP